MYVTKNATWKSLVSRMLGSKLGKSHVLMEWKAFSLNFGLAIPS
jgi:hypothetical protein